MSATATPAVFITVPKYVAISPSTNIVALSKIRPAPMAVVAEPVAATTEDGAPKSKKRRLDHLTWEEKIQRKKLKNRVAAQTSRDRKKARMEDMEYELRDISQKTEILQNKCESLQAINDSLLEKNRRLDMEVEMLREQLTELQQQQQQQKQSTKSVATNTVGTCAGWITSNGLTVDTRTTETEQQHGGALEDCCPLPTLQDMLLLDEEFDAGKLEELAESLLADITADMEAGDRESNEAVAKVAGRAERLPGPVVGTTAERLESSEHSTAHTQSSCLNEQKPQTETETNMVIEMKPTFTLQNTLQANAKVTANVTATTTKTTTALSATPDTVYGTYDAKTNSITIVMDDDTVPVNEAVEEIYCEGVSPPALTDVAGIKCPTPAASPSQVYLNVDEDEDGEEEEDDVLNFDPIAKFLCPKRPLLSPLAKSPAPSLHSATSDHGYESYHGSPTNTNLEHFDASSIEDDDFAWHNSGFIELFPTLI